MNWSIKEQVPTFAVPDLELGVQFYSRLGFEVEWRWPKTGTTCVGLRHGLCALMLSLCEPAERGDIYYVVDDVRACYEHLQTTRPWGIAEVFCGSRKRKDCPLARSLVSPVAPSLRDHGHVDFSIADTWGHQSTFGREVID
ncbi:MAG: hypothetical protein M2R45_02778 [Verrucomicrobia subdivision 3 bacterium]|nr:hypothetical protein [Limisphaerales bacterium]MCS1414328.1 hypothetical protein [Limisphaerales bacterium]